MIVVYIEGFHMQKESAQLMTEFFCGRGEALGGKLNEGVVKSRLKNY